jgi:hypothetical protein
VDGRDAVQVAVQERVVDLKSTSFEEGEAREDTGDDSFVLGAEGSGGDEDVDGDGYWWWQSTEAKAARWVVPQWEVLAADRQRGVEGRAEGTVDSLQTEGGAQKRKEGGLWTACSRGQSAGARWQSQ